ncbi:MAG: hypothetical protein N2690_11910 [Rhodocyclaceae bacterium]|nr:hypothetical protein [Rhodocyclaceae bacterium]
MGKKSIDLYAQYRIKQMWQGGCTLHEIAHALEISHETVTRQVARLFGKSESEVKRLSREREAEAMGVR